MLNPFLNRLVGSPACLPGTALEPLLAIYRDLGLSKFEAFSSWAEARLDWKEDPTAARKLINAHGITVTSFHLPPINQDIDAGVANALHASRYAAALGDDVVVLFKAATREIFSEAAKPYLDGLESEDIKVTPVVQNHKGTAITTLEDYREVLDSINDPRIQGLLEVGHFHRVGVSWQQGWEFLEGRIGLIHINEIRRHGTSE